MSFTFCRNAIFLAYLLPIPNVAPFLSSVIRFSDLQYNIFFSVYFVLTVIDSCSKNLLVLLLMSYEADINLQAKCDSAEIQMFSCCEFVQLSGPS